MPETNIILAVIGVVGLLSTLAVYSRANNASLSYERRLLRQRNVNRVAHEDEWLSSCNGCALAINNQPNKLRIRYMVSYLSTIRWETKWLELVSGCYSMQSKHGYITIATHLQKPCNSIKNCVKSCIAHSSRLYNPRTQKQNHPNHVQLASVPMQTSPPKLYDVTLRSGTISLLAPDSESAAWMALELSHERDDELINVKQADEW